MFQDTLKIKIEGHGRIVDDLGNVLLDKFNAVHPENMARVFSRALSNENNFVINRIAFGNGGSTTDAASVVTLNPPNDGQPPDVRTWDSRLYNEIYSEIIDAGNSVINPNLGVDPGSADSNTGNRPGGDSVPSQDPVPTLHVSGPGVRSVEQGLTSQIIVTCVINTAEPTFATPDVPFTFDEMGLYTTGAPAASFPGTADVDVGNKTSTNPTNLVQSASYSFQIAVDGGGFKEITFVSPVNTPSYGQLCDALNTGDVSWNPSWAGVSPLPAGATVAISDVTTSFPTITGSSTNGNLRFTSATVGSTSSITVNNGSVDDLFASNVLAAGRASIILSPVEGRDAGVQNDPLNPTIERERLIAHLIFNPISKAPGRTLTITYTITVSVARSTSQL